jgi:hypothetical protein
MAKLFDLCENVPAKLVRIQQTSEIKARVAQTYAKRMDKLGMESAIFAECKGARTQKRVRNTWSSEQAGRIGTVTVTRRFSGSHISDACKAQNVY